MTRFTVSVTMTGPDSPALNDAISAATTTAMQMVEAARRSVPEADRSSVKLANVSIIDLNTAEADEEAPEEAYLAVGDACTVLDTNGTVLGTGNVASVSEPTRRGPGRLTLDTTPDT